MGRRVIGAQVDADATVGDSRAARMAGYRPAMTPTTAVARDRHRPSSRA